MKDKYIALCALWFNLIHPPNPPRKRGGEKGGQTRMSILLNTCQSRQTGKKLIRQPKPPNGSASEPDG